MFFYLIRISNMSATRSKPRLHIVIDGCVIGYDPLTRVLQVHVNPSQSVLVLEGDDIESFNRAVQQVTYRNSLRFATPGVRPLKLTTSLR